MSKFARRHRGALATAAMMALALVAAVAVSSSLAVRYAQAQRRANQALTESEESRSLANLRLEQTLKAHENLFQSLGETLLNDPEMRQLERLLDKPRGFSEGLTNDLASSRDFRSRRLPADGKPGLVRIDILLGRTSEAHRGLEEVTALYGSLSVDPLEVPDHRERLALAHNNLAAALAHSGDQAGAAAELREALVRYEPLSAANPGDKPPTSAPERTRWRRQALDWLKADLAHWSRLNRSGLPQTRVTVKQTLGHWKAEVDALLKTVGPR